MFVVPLNRFLANRLRKLPGGTAHEPCICKPTMRLHNARHYKLLDSAHPAAYAAGSPTGFAVNIPPVMITTRRVSEGYTRWDFRPSLTCRVVISLDDFCLSLTRWVVNAIDILPVTV